MERGCKGGCGRECPGLYCDECNAAASGGAPAPAPSSSALAGEPSRTFLVGEPKPAGRMTVTERRFAAAFLEPRLQRGESHFHLFDRIRFRLADGCWYKPDFFEALTSGGLWIHEVKGPRIWDGSKEKFRIAAEQYPWARWTLTQWKDGEWRVLLDVNPAAAPLPGEG